MAKLQTFVTGNGDERRTLVVVFLRGGADGLNLVAPLDDDGYYKARPRIGIARKDAVPLNGFFGLNPLMKDLEPAWKDGLLSIIHQAGSEDTTRSHFEAQDLMEHGGVVAGGWLGRFLRFRNGAPAGALSTVALGRELPECLRGAPSATVIQSLDEFSLGGNSTKLQRQLAGLYGLESGPLGGAARDTLSAIERIANLRAKPYLPSNGAEYARDEFSQGLRQIARLIKARVGLESASLDLNGWDSHLNQGAIMDPRIRNLAEGLASFTKDLGDAMATTSVVVMTEFGRRVVENSAFGTDHGRASVMFVLGGGVTGGKVFSKWGGLKEELLEGPGDLPVVHNYRNVLAPVLQRHGAGTDFSKIFPDFTVEPMAIYG